MRKAGRVLFTFGLILGIVVFLFLLLHSFYPEIINIDKYTFYFLGILLFLLLIPSLKSGKLTYLFEFKRNVGGFKSLVKKVRKRK